jgi:glutathione S-transferase
MKLFVSPGACSMSCHIALTEAKIPFEPVIGDYEQVERLNPMGAVPVLQFDDGRALTQNVAILTWATTQYPQLLPKPGTYEHAQAYQWLSWTSSDLHPEFSPLFTDTTPEDEKKNAVEIIQKRLAIAEKHLTGKTYLAAEQFTIADCLFFTIYGWTKWVNIPTDQYRALNEYAARIAERPSVQTVMKREDV